MSLNFIQCSTIISYTIFIGCLTLRFDLSDYRLTAHVTYGIQRLCSFVILCGRQFSNVRQSSALMTQNEFQICQAKIRSRYTAVFNIFVSEFPLFLSPDYSTYSSLCAYVITNSYHVTWIPHTSSHFSE